MSTTPAPSRATAVYAGATWLLLAVYLAWYVGVWPGPLGEDGYALIAHINAGQPDATGKDPAWLLYALGTYGVSQRIESLMLPLVVLQAFVLARMIGWVFLHGRPMVAAMLLVFVACTPHVLNFATSVYPDAVFSLAFIAVLFEIWIVLRSGKLRPSNVIILFILFPIACFFKGNGFIILIPIFYLAHRIQGTARWIALVTVLFWTVTIQAGGKAADLGHGHSVLRPLILFETINFMQSRPMDLWENRNMVTPRTREIVYRYISQEDIDRFYDRDYWDTLWHKNQDRIKLRQMTKKDRHDLRIDFFTYNLWRNIPAFISSRVNIFLAAAFAQGGFSNPDNSKYRIDKIDTRTTYNPFGFNRLPALINNIYDNSYNWRFLLWSPFVGLILLLCLLKKSIRFKNIDSMVISLTLSIQLIAIFTFSIAAEYRYLLMFFYAPLALAPMLLFMNANPGSKPCQL